MRAFPIFLQAEGRTIIVFGGGAEAAAKLRLVVKTEAHVLVVAPELVTGEIDLGDAEWVQTDPLDFAFPDNTALAYAATGDEALDAQIADHARANHVLVCAADQPDVSDFITPAIVDRDPVVIAIGTEGTAPVLARMIKAQIEAALPQGLGALAKLANGFRDRVADAIAPGSGRRQFWRTFFKGALQGRLDVETASKRAEALLSGQNDVQTREGFVSFVGAGPGGQDLMTLRARKLLDEADVVLFDALVAPEILELARREALMVNVGKRCGKHSLKQHEICDLITQHAGEGHHVVRLKGGDPAIFGRLAEELDAVSRAGLAFEVVPGVTAAAAASASAAAPLTERGHAQELRVITAHGADGDADVDWASLARSDSAIAVYMGKRAAADVQRQLILNGRAPSTPVVLVENAGRSDERIHSTSLGALANTAKTTGKGAPLMMLIGVVSRRAAAQRTYLQDQPTSSDRKAA
ncbi:MAG: uroporphyrinogen-III C-methyltransferase [Rhizobiales bacterium]|nr:uroporphyrinogen-III C-methyltransferase [Hyphomicrobiales bacterium]MBO6698625.1 uroporphyrinogen-III C-methyltransferase [Hyphomicrobiales bacterium]MBO6735122.1 uroporphyrinogen-III C-methyltransferase [Hyphomicrobiales bacterium]MBO6911071.1 uroporphyrinogen-III C-methyltransferase [Hyphomicrobiales bacterium]MBO6957363.1 uroporphyrinogen-III C-methyltransferase [Hyphomicrobiales bacterium]